MKRRLAAFASLTSEGSHEGCTIGTSDGYSLAMSSPSEILDWSRLRHGERYRAKLPDGSEVNVRYFGEWAHEQGLHDFLMEVVTYDDSGTTLSERHTHVLRSDGWRIFPADDAPHT